MYLLFTGFNSKQAIIGTQQRNLAGKFIALAFVQALRLVFCPLLNSVFS
jgi:hypothetical protein